MSPRLHGRRVLPTTFICAFLDLFFLKGAQLARAVNPLGEVMHSARDILRGRSYTLPCAKHLRGQRDGRDRLQCLGTLEQLLMLRSKYG